MAKEALETNSTTKEALARAESAGRFGSGRFGVARFGEGGSAPKKEALAANTNTKEALNP